LVPRGGVSIKSYQSDRGSVSKSVSSLGICIEIFSISELNKGPGLKLLVLNRRITGLIPCRRLLFDGYGERLYRWIKTIEKHDDYISVCVCVCVCVCEIIVCRYNGVFF